MPKEGATNAQEIFGRVPEFSPEVNAAAVRTLSSLAARAGVQADEFVDLCAMLSLVPVKASTG